MNNGSLKISPFNVSHGICSTIILFIFYVFCTRHIQVAKNNSKLTRKEAVNKKNNDSLLICLKVYRYKCWLSQSTINAFIFLIQALKTRV